MVGEDELENRAADTDDVGVVSRDLHTGCCFRATGAKKLRRSCIADNADATGGTRLEIRMIAERRDLDVRDLGRIQDAGALRDFHRGTVNFQLYHV